MNNFPHVDMLIEMALFEDLGTTGDITSDAIFTNEVYSYRLVAKDTGILCGIEIFVKVMDKVDPSINVTKRFNDRDLIKTGDIVADVSGPVKSILKAERTALNFISHLSGIATKTAKFVEETGGRCTILDTRKTLPGYRELQKYAVACGGGSNHRMGLYDMVMIKDNHSDAARGIPEASGKVRAAYGSRYRVEIEARNIDEVARALQCGADRIMLDNMNIEDMKKSVALVSGKAETEASGNMTIERICEVSMTGVNYISVGELTHSVKAFDFSLKELKTGGGS